MTFVLRVFGSDWDEGERYDISTGFSDGMRKERLTNWTDLVYPPHIRDDRLLFRLETRNDLISLGT